ncbi:hypothetical protein [Amycolatopsis sp. NPDC051071]|uniref:hypothetical protein n=1 Tax=Amycolatopsis sp. NPDC051071 TaxID=3154637 RepID=UPI0034256EDA
MNPQSLSEELQASLESLDHVFQAFTEEIGKDPTLGEFLEIVSLSFQSDEDALSDVPFPLLLKAKKRGNRWYKAEPSDQVASLNDNTFNEAAEFLNLLVERISANRERKLSAEDLATHLLEVLQAGERIFADIAAEDVQALVPPAAKKTFRAKTGDVVAIPAVTGGHHLAVVLGEDTTGLAVGLLEGVFSLQRIGDVGKHRVRHMPVHTGTRLIRDGTWPIVGNHPALLALFPDPPDIYWQAVTAWGGRFGDYGGAGNSDGPIRLIGKAEAEAVGLLDGTYRSSYLEEQFQRLLDEGRFDNGPTPRSWL